jgi:hypothetical protein
MPARPAHRKNNGSERVQQYNNKKREENEVILFFAQGSWNINIAEASTTPFEISIRDEH